MGQHQVRTQPVQEDQRNFCSFRAGFRSREAYGLPFCAVAGCRLNGRERPMPCWGHGRDYCLLSWQKDKEEWLLHNGDLDRSRNRSTLQRLTLQAVSKRPQRHSRPRSSDLQIRRPSIDEYGPLDRVNENRHLGTQAIRDRLKTIRGRICRIDEIPVRPDGCPTATSLRLPERRKLRAELRALQEHGF